MNLKTGISDGGGTARYSNKYKATQPMICVHCGVLVASHLKCNTCDILLHQIDYKCHCGAAHTLTKDGIDCESCVNIRENGNPEYDLNATSYLFSALT